LLENKSFVFLSNNLELFKLKDWVIYFDLLLIFLFIVVDIFPKKLSKLFEDLTFAFELNNYFMLFNEFLLLYCFLLPLNPKIFSKSFLLSFYFKLVKLLYFFIRLGF